MAIEFDKDKFSFSEQMKAEGYKTTDEEAKSIFERFEKLAGLPKGKRPSKEELDEYKRELEEKHITISGIDFAKAISHASEVIALKEGIIESIKFMKHSSMLMSMLFDKEEN